MKEGFILIKENSFEKARKLIKEAQKKGKKIIFTSNDDDLNRKIIEKEKIDILLLTLSERKDRQKQRDSGFNHVLAKIAQKNDIVLGINTDEITESNLKQKAEILSRIKQNIKICKKNKVEMRFISLKEKEEKNSYNLKSLGLILGMPTSMIKKL
jgi:ribonuclease P/MRP protein subunit RPP1